MESPIPYSTERLTLDEMKSFLWSAATHLRGQIDATGYKEFIFPLLFFKRISDVYDEKYQMFAAEAGEEYANAQMEDEDIKIPEGAHWRDVRCVTENVGQALVNAFTAIERANPPRIEGGRRIGGLTGIFGPKGDWTNKAKMPDDIILSLIEDFSKHTLSLAACPADEMGQAYEYLIGKFADDAGHTAQEFYTNRTIVELMAEILQLKPDESLYDPTCGSGGMLVKSLDYLRSRGEEWRGVKVFGQEIDAITSSIARMNLFLNDVKDFSVEVGDTLRDPKFLDGSQLRRFDVVLANPPYSIKDWNRTAFENDPFARNFLGTPPQRYADFAFIQHILASMDEENGRCAILLPQGILNRSGEEAKIRMELIERDLLDCVINIGKNLFYNSAMPACILLCRSNKPDERKNKVIFIEASDLIEKQADGLTIIPKVHQNTIKTIYEKYQDIDGRAKVVDVEEMRPQKGSLMPNVYVNRVNVLSLDELESSLSQWVNSSINFHDSIDKLSKML